MQSLTQTQMPDEPIVINWIQKRTFAALLSAAVVSVAALGCGEDEPAQHHDVPVFVDGTALQDVETDTGYHVEVESVAIGVQAVEFTVGGEGHDESEIAWIEGLTDLFAPEAMAHPNHAAGGEVGGVIGEPGTLEWRPEETVELGVGSFLEGDYRGYDIPFAPHLDETHTGGADIEVMARIEGVATSDAGEEIRFGADIEYTEGAGVVGGAFAAAIPKDVKNGVALRLHTHDDWSDQTLFDGIEFSDHLEASESQSRAEIAPGTTDNARIGHAVTAHEFYDAVVVDDP